MNTYTPACTLKFSSMGVLVVRDPDCSLLWPTDVQASMHNYDYLPDLICIVTVHIHNCKWPLSVFNLNARVPWNTFHILYLLISYAIVLNFTRFQKVPVFQFCLYQFLKYQVNLHWNHHRRYSVAVLSHFWRRMLTATSVCPWELEKAIWIPIWRFSFLSHIPHIEYVSDLGPHMKVVQV